MILEMVLCHVVLNKVCLAITSTL